MKFSCPHCRHECDYEDMEMDADLLAIIKLLPAFGAHGSLVCAYTELFGITPLKTRRRKWRLLLEEIKRLYDSESFVYNRRRYDISHAGIAEALSVVVHRHWTDHLENHNYLKKIMIGIAEQEGKAAGRQAEKDRHTREERLRSGSRPTAQSETEAQVRPPPARLSEEARQENLHRLGDIIKRIG